MLLGLLPHAYLFLAKLMDPKLAADPNASPAIFGNTKAIFSGDDSLGIKGLASPLLVGAQVLVPVAVAIAGIHKLVNHQETGMAVLLETLVRGVGAIAVIQLVKILAGL